MDERAYADAMNIRNKKETKSMLVNTIQKWREELRSEGRVIGELETSMLNTKRMLEKNLSWNLIAEITGVTQKQYDEWEKTKEVVMNAA